MIYRELEKAMSGSDAKIDTDIMISVGDIRYKVDSAEFDPESKVFVIRSDESAKANTYQLEFEIYQDHKLIGIDKPTVHEASDADVIVNIDKFGYDTLKRNGIEGELQDKTGSIKTETEITELTKTGKPKKNAKPKKEIHFYSFKAREVMKLIDEENDIYVRIWKNGDIA